jgi:S-adenosylmethionine hydrolase
MARPIVFLTDYGLTDEFVGICHGVIATVAPDIRVIDLTHAIPRQEVLRGAVTLSRAVPFMPGDAVYLGVVDPGVGSARRAIAVQAASGALLVGPDNGLLSMAWDGMGGVIRAVEVTSDRIVLRPISATFHGRDVFAPAAAHLATGGSIEDLGAGLDPSSLRTVETPGAMITGGVIGARVMRVDGYGNVQLNVRAEDLQAAGLEGPIEACGLVVPRAGTFADVPEGAVAAIIDGQGFVSIVVNRGSAAKVLGLGPGAPVTLSRAGGPDPGP